MKDTETAQGDAQNAPKPRVQTAVRTISILLAISRSGHGLKARELSEQLKLPRQVTYHLLHTLLSTGIILKNDQNRYVLGLAAASIAEGFRRQLAPPEHLSPRVRAAVTATRETAFASGWMGGQIVVLATAKGLSAVQAAEVPHGYSGHAHARASGKLLLALSNETKRDEYLAANPLVAMTSRTITDQRALVKELQEIAQRGYAVDNEEFSEGLCCLAVPVEGLEGQYALSISVPAERFHANFDRYLQTLRRLAGVTLDQGAKSLAVGA
ncbi:MAG: IclR family transcriptional regulator [Parvibaculaceae bacterium]